MNNSTLKESHTMTKKVFSSSTLLNWRNSEMIEYDLRVSN